MFELEVRARLAKPLVDSFDQPQLKKSPGRIPAEPTFGEIVCRASSQLMDCSRIFSHVSEGCHKIFEMTRAFFG